MFEPGIGDLAGNADKRWAFMHIALAAGNDCSVRALVAQVEFPQVVEPAEVREGGISHPGIAQVKVQQCFPLLYRYFHQGFPGLIFPLQMVN